MRRRGRLVVSREETFTFWLFFREDSRRAADALLDEPRAKGNLTPRDMGGFVKRLEAGDLGFRFSKDNFYKKVLGTLLNLGFVKMGSVYGGIGGKTLEVYLPVRQPIPSKAPSNPSFWSITYQICRWWNELMFSGDENYDSVT